MGKMLGTWLFVATLIMSGDAAALIGDAQITHRAVNSGAWFSAATWDAGVPGVGDIALVPA